MHFDDRRSGRNSWLLILESAGVEVAEGERAHERISNSRCKLCVKAKRQSRVDFHEQPQRQTDIMYQQLKPGFFFVARLSLPTHVCIANCDFATKRREERGRTAGTSTSINTTPPLSRYIYKSLLERD